MPKKISIVGAGYTGLSAAYELAKAGHQVTIFEKDHDIGGLAGTFELEPGRRIEKFYHHWFTSDTAIIDFAKELGFGDKLRYVATNTGLYFANSIFRLASPKDLLSFSPIPFLDRIRTGLMALYARRISNWKPLEKITAEDWIKKIGGKAAYEVIWKPLLAGKFGAEAPHVSAVWFWNKLKLRGSSRNDKGGESLVYIDGGFSTVTGSIISALEKLGVTFRLSTAVDQVISEKGEVTGVKVGQETIPCDVALLTAPLPTCLRIAPQIPEEIASKAEQIRFLGNVCLILRLKRSLSSTYWLNVADPTFPFVGVIEHTNLDDKSNYGGEHIAYISKYLSTSDSMFLMSDQEVIEYALPYVKKIFPEFTDDWLIKAHVWRAEYSQPVITKNYSEFIPPSELPVKGLWLATMAQIYPEDRGTNYAVKFGREVGRGIDKSVV